MSGSPVAERLVRVAVVLPRYTPIFGGAENQARQLNRALVREGSVAIPFIVTKRIAPSLPPSDVIDGIVVRRLGKPGISRWSEYGFYIRAFVFLFRRRRQFDVVHCHATAVIGFVMTVLGHVTGKPVVLKLSSNGELVTGRQNFDGRLELERTLSARARRPLVRFMARRAHIVALNEEGADELQLADVRHPLRLRNGVDTSRFGPTTPAARAALRASHGFTADDFIFVYTGRFVATKGIDVLMEAIGLIEARGAAPRAKFAFVGSGELQGARVDVLDTDRARVFPPVDDVLPFLQLADAFVFPSRREGMPNAVLEALAVGLPCVLSDIRPHRELAGENPASRCFLFASGNAESLALALSACVAEQSAEPSRGRIDARFSLDEVARVYRELYRRLSA